MIIHAHKDGKLAYTGIFRLAMIRFGFKSGMYDNLVIHNIVYWDGYTLSYSWEDDLNG